MSWEEPRRPIVVQGSSGQVLESNDGHSRKEAQREMGTLRFGFFVSFGLLV